MIINHFIYRLYKQVQKEYPILLCFTEKKLPCNCTGITYKIPSKWTGINYVNQTNLFKK